MTTGRTNQVTAVSLRPRAQACSSRTPRGTGYGTALHAPMGLRTEHHTPVCNPFTQASSSAWSGSWTVSRRTHTYPAATAATSSSLGSRADPGCSRTGCIQLFSQRYREITGATPLATMPRTGPVSYVMLCYYYV